ncbi:MAG: chorismate synthase [Eubacteriales bacterium]|jgi:chorismate synthase
MASYFGRNIRISIFGQSHSPAIGVTIDGLPAGTQIDLQALEAFMERRAPGRSKLATRRREADSLEIISGLAPAAGEDEADGGRYVYTCGAPLCIIIRNVDAQSRHYEEMQRIPRPSHSDFTAFSKYGKWHDVNGGGHFSGRLTAPLCAAGGIALQLLGNMGIKTAAYLSSVGPVNGRRTDPLNPDMDALIALSSASFPALAGAEAEAMAAEIENAAKDGDSVGGIIELIATGIPVGIGEMMFAGLESHISSAVFAVPGVKGIEFGSGFAGSSTRGSVNNDPFYPDGDAIKTSSNNHGGILGGISSGMPLVFRVAMKPTPSIAIEQNSVDMGTMEAARIAVQGRHDPCIALRAVPCIEAAAALAIYDLYLENLKQTRESI